jgi:hypothetical protein
VQSVHAAKKTLAVEHVRAETHNMGEPSIREVIADHALDMWAYLMLVRRLDAGQRPPTDSMSSVGREATHEMSAQDADETWPIVEGATMTTVSSAAVIGARYVDPPLGAPPDDGTFGPIQTVAVSIFAGAAVAYGAQRSRWSAKDVVRVETTGMAGLAAFAGAVNSDGSVAHAVIGAMGGVGAAIGSARAVYALPYWLRARINDGVIRKRATRHYGNDLRRLSTLTDENEIADFAYKFGDALARSRDAFDELMDEYPNAFPELSHDEYELASVEAQSLLIVQIGRKQGLFPEARGRGLTGG